MKCTSQVDGHYICEKRPLEDLVDLKVAGMVVGLLEYVEVHLVVEWVAE